MKAIQKPALQLRDTPEKQSTHSLPKIEHNTKSVLKEIQRLIRGLYSLSRDGQARDGQVETDAGKRVTANVELHANRTFGKNFHAAAIIDRELGTNVSEARDGGGLIFCPSENRPQAGGSIRRDRRERDLKTEVAMVKKSSAATVDEIRRIRKCVLSTDHLSVAVSNPEYTKRFGVQIARYCRGLSGSLQR